KGAPAGAPFLVWGVHGALLTAACIAVALIKEWRAFGALYLVSSSLDATSEVRTLITSQVDKGFNLIS
uniref:hypothetical protein n=1 Tax=uncultured Senegalimassilia sp. TaxID=1714350 RepID=UPI002584E689